MNNKQDIWLAFCSKYNLSAEQKEQFQRYCSLLIEWNGRINLTAIINEADIIAYHFEDSLELTRFYNFNSCSMMVDVGTGAGFPGIPIKILYPHISIVLIEVLQKRVIFLEKVIQDLGLKNVTLHSEDWRTFLRKTQYPSQLVCARASLRPDELLRMFQPSSPYKQATLVYWASQDWKLSDRESLFLQNEYTYQVGNRSRRYLFFKAE